VAQVLSSRINSKVKAIWKKLRNKEYRDSFVASQISNTIAAQIFSLREARGWKQAEVAARAGMKQSRISDLEDPNYENYQTRTLVKLASAFDVGLVVKFVPFSELAKWSANLSPRDFLPTEFLKDGVGAEIEDIGVAQRVTLAKPENPANISNMGSNINYIDVDDVPSVARISFRMDPTIHSPGAALLFDLARCDRLDHANA
jgi:transcriptional regulator with XRE-family HTH domain